MGEKLLLLRDEEKYDWDSGTNEPELASAKDNQRTVADFVKRAIVAAGFTPRVKVDRDYYDPYSKVYIKDLGGKFYIRCTDSFSEAGGDLDDSEVEVDSFELGCSDYRCALEEGDGEVVYRSFDAIVEKLSKHLNQYAGTCRTLTKGEAKIITKAA